MAIVYEETVLKVKSIQCDRCKETKPVSLKDELNSIHSDKWLFLDGDRMLCPECVKAVVDSWYSHGEFDFKLDGSAKVSKKKSRRVVA